jgi:hypothetical protein
MSIALHPDKRVHRLLIIEPAEPLISRSGRARPRWRCRCACGRTVLVLQQSLELALSRSSGGSRSCGCLARERVTRHGHNTGRRPSPEYLAWLAAKKRCNNPRSSSYGGYGARGIAMCRAWSESFEAFLDDLGPRPGPTYSLDRIDGRRGYEPDNCRWADRETQARNRRGVRYYEFDGSIGILADWARYFGAPRERLRYLIRRGIAPIQPVPPEAIDPRLLPPRPVLDLNAASLRDLEGGSLD